MSSKQYKDFNKSRLVLTRTLDQNEVNLFPVDYVISCNALLICSHFLSL